MANACCNGWNFQCGQLTEADFHSSALFTQSHTHSWTSTLTPQLHLTINWTHKPPILPITPLNLTLKLCPSSHAPTIHFSGITALNLWCPPWNPTCKRDAWNSECSNICSVKSKNEYVRAEDGNKLLVGQW